MALLRFVVSTKSRVSFAEIALITKNQSNVLTLFTRRMQMGQDFGNKIYIAISF